MSLIPILHIIFFISSSIVETTKYKPVPVDRHPGLRIMTLNIEGIKSNFNYLQDLAKDHNLIICLQEHWLWGYETNFFEKHFPLHTIFSRSHDDNDPIPNFKARRGQAGTAIMWPSSLNKFIHKLPDGNSRVIAIKIELENHTVCLINAYMPTLAQNSQIL